MNESQALAINGVLDEIEEYLDQRADADGVPSGGGYTPNEEMRLLTDLRWWRTVIKPQPEVARAEVRLNDDGTLDEVVCRGDQLEQMDYNHWFLSMGDVAVWLHAKGTITASYERRAPQSREEPK